MEFIRLIRPHQWIKNSFVLVGVIFGFQTATHMDWLHAAYVFLAFCLAASTVYIFNDILDLEADKTHPKKRFRPIAAGTFSIKFAVIMSVAMAIAAGMIALAASSKALLLIFFYLLINVAYTLHLKHLAVVDVFCISSGFMLRLLAGTWGIGIEPSNWLLITGMMITLLLGFGKRRSELASISDIASRKSLEQYTISLLDTYIAICAAATIITYGLYTVSDSTIGRHHTSNLLWTTPIVTFGIFRYLYLIHRFGKGQDTSRDILSDTPLLITALIWCICTVLIIKVFA